MRFSSLLRAAPAARSVTPSAFPQRRSPTRERERKTALSPFFFSARTAPAVRAMASASTPAPTPAARDRAADMLAFINASPTQFHAVANAAARLDAAGFVRIAETDAWALAPGGRYYFVRNGSTLVAFAVGGAYAAGGGFHMVGAHTDSPTLKVKPVSAGTRSGYAMVNVEPYGGGLWTTWFDRDLTVAGRVLVKEGGGGGGASGGLRARLVAVDGAPLLRIPMLAIHLQRELADKGFAPNKAQHVVPVLASAAAAELNGAKPDASASGPTPKHHAPLLAAVAAAAGVDPASIADFDLNLCDTQAGVVGGAHKEFVFCGRLDNLAMSYCATSALIDAFGAASPGGDARLAGEGAVKAVALFDHEEVGSASAQGAGGPVMRDAIFRAARALATGDKGGDAREEEEGAVVRALQASFLVSADMAHAVHPNYADRHDPDHRPRFGGGLVIKHNANQRYATDAVSAALFREVGASRGIPCQEFCVKSDMACGSTIGPILASGLGVRTVDVGAPQLSMHSIREMCGVADVGHAHAHLRAFFEDFSSLLASCDFDALAPPVAVGVLDDPPCCETE